MACETGDCPHAQKPIHGAPIPMWKRLGLLERSPVDGDGLRIGQLVTFKNDYGLEFDSRIIGFSMPGPVMHYAYIHLIGANADSESGFAWWFPHRIDQISKILEWEV